MSNLLKKIFNMSNDYDFFNGLFSNIDLAILIQ